MIETADIDNGGEHFVKHHDYSPDEFLQSSEESQYKCIRVIDESGSGQSEDFDHFKQMKQSEWSINYASAARLTDGTLLYEGQQ